MRVVKPSIEVFFYVPENGMSTQQMIEMAARTCYQSEGSIEDGSDDKLIKKLLKRGHHAMVEFGYAMVKIIADRGLTHEAVRHRLTSLAQESTRWCNYAKDKFGSSITVVELPDVPNMTQELIDHWHASAERMEADYFKAERMAKEAGISKPAQIARMWLPIGLKSALWMGANTREWRHIFRMRCAKDAHPIIRGVMLEALEKFNEKHPAIYGDLYEEFILSAK